MGLVDDEQVVLRQHLAPLEGVDRHEGVVRHDDVDLLRVGARHFDEAVLDDGALAAEALVARDGDLAPRPLGHAGHEFVAVAGFGLVGPLPQAHDLAAGASGVFVDLADAHERALVVVRVATGELVLAQVVTPPLDERVRGPAPEQRFERVGEARHVAIDDLRLEGERRRGHDGRLVHLERVTDRGHEVSQRLSGARTRLHEQVLVALDGLLDGVRHRRLPRPRDAADAGDGRGHEFVERGQFGHAPTLWQHRDALRVATRARLWKRLCGRRHCGRRPHRQPHTVHSPGRTPGRCGA